MATVASLTFTPSRAGRLLVVVSYDVQVTTGTDWGAAARTRIAVTQGGTTYSDSLSMSTTRQRHTAQAFFNVAAGSPVTVALDGAPGSPGQASWWGISIQALLLKK